MDMNRNCLRKLLVPSILTCALLTTLALATTASAEIRVGEATVPVNPAIKPEVNVTAGKAEYNSDTGAVTLKVTTAAAPSPGTPAEPTEVVMVAAVASMVSCSVAAISSNLYPAFAFQYEYAQPDLAMWSLFESISDEPKAPETAGVVGISTIGTTTTFTATAPKAANRPFNCALVIVTGASQSPGGYLFFPIAVPPPPPAPVPTPVPAPAPPQSAPAALSIAKSKPLKLKVGQWKTVRVKVANTGGTATRTGSLRLKAPRGVLVKPEKQKLPVLTAGASWTVSAKVQLTAKARQKSTLSLTAAAGTTTAKSSLVLKRQG